MQRLKNIAKQTMTQAAECSANAYNNNNSIRRFIEIRLHDFQQWNKCYNANKFGTNAIMPIKLHQVQQCSSPIYQ